MQTLPASFFVHLRVIFVNLRVTLLPKTMTAALAGESIDRLRFYASLDIVTPRGTMAEALREKA